MLMEDHRRILELLTLLHDGAERVSGESRPPSSLFELGIALGKDYVDRFHHYKEEYLLFGVLALKHEGHLDGMIERHRQQHELARDVLASLSQALDGYGRGSDQQVVAIRQGILSYVHAMRAHIRSENEVFFPLASAALTDTEAQVLLDQFEKYEATVAPHANEQMESGLAKLSEMLGEG